MHLRINWGIQHVMELSKPIAMSRTTHADDYIYGGRIRAAIMPPLACFRNVISKGAPRIFPGLGSVAPAPLVHQTEETLKLGNRLFSTSYIDSVLRSRVVKLSHSYFNALPLAIDIHQSSHLN